MLTLLNPTLLLLLLLFSKLSESDDFLTNYPSPNSSNNRLLGMILSGNLGHIDPLVITINEYLSMCEEGWDVYLVVFSLTKWSTAMLRYFRQRSYCYRTNSSLASINIILLLFTSNKLYKLYTYS